MLGFYTHFPQTIHFSQMLPSSVSKHTFQQRLICLLEEMNRKAFTFEEVANPTIPECALFFEFGVAYAENFIFLNAEEAKNLHSVLSKRSFAVLDLFCAIRYYKVMQEKRVPLKFDYYILRLSFGENGVVEFRIFHEKGPRYLTPEDLVTFIAQKVNEGSKRKTMTLG
jgi:hypothetical protein